MDLVTPLIVCALVGGAVAEPTATESTLDDRAAAILESEVGDFDIFSPAEVASLLDAFLNEGDRDLSKKTRAQFLERRAIAHSNLDRHDKAIDDLEKAVAYDLENVGLQARYIRILLRANPQKATELSELLVDRFPRSPEALLTAAVVARSSGNRDRARMWLEAEQDSSLDNARRLTMFANLALDDHDASTTRILTNEVLLRYPVGADSDLFAFRGLASLSAGFPLEAANNFAVSQNLRSRADATVLFWISLERLHQDATCVLLAEMLVANSPNAPLPRLLLCLSWMANQELDKAQQACDEMARLPGGGETSDWVHGSLAWLRGDFPDALIRFDRCLASKPDNLHARFRKAWFLVASQDPQLRNPQAALDTLDGIPPVADNAARIAFALLRAVARTDLKQHARATDALAQANEVAKGNELLLRMVQSARGAFADAAIDDAERAQVVFPKELFRHSVFYR